MRFLAYFERQTGVSKIHEKSQKSFYGEGLRYHQIHSILQRKWSTLLLLEHVQLLEGERRKIRLLVMNLQA